MNDSTRAAGGFAFQQPMAFDPENRDVFSCTHFDTGQDELAGAGHGGMTLRDWFAGMTLAGFQATSWQVDEVTAQDAYKMADLMLAERRKQVPPTP